MQLLRFFSLRCAITLAGELNANPFYMQLIDKRVARIARAALIRGVVGLLLLFIPGPELEAAEPRWNLQHQIATSAKPRVISFSQDGKLIAVGHADGKVSVWDSQTGHSVTSFQAHSDAVRSAQFVPDRESLVTVGSNQAIVWSTKDWTRLSEIEGVAFRGAVSPDGRTLAAYSLDYGIRLWDLDSGKSFKQLNRDKEGT